MWWWRWVLLTATALVCASGGFPAGVWVFVLALTLWALRVGLVFDRPARLTDADLEALLNG